MTLQSAPGASCSGQQPCPETGQQVSSNIPQSESGLEEEEEEQEGVGGEVPNEIRMMRQINYCSI